MGEDDWFGVFTDEVNPVTSYREADGTGEEDLDVDDYVQDMVRDVRGGFDMKNVDKSVYDSVLENSVGGLGGEGGLEKVVESLKGRIVGDGGGEVETFREDEDGVKLEDGTVDIRTIAVDQVGRNYTM